MTAASGTISTVVPSSVLSNFSFALASAQVTGLGMAVDQGGTTIWLSAPGQILKITLASATVATTATGDPFRSAIALAPNGDTVFYSDLSGTPSFMRTSAASGTTTTVFSGQVPCDKSQNPFPGCTAPMSPSGLAADSAGNIYFSNSPQAQAAYPADAIFKIDSSGNLTQVAASPPSTEGTILGDSLAVDPAGNVYFSSIDSTVRRLALAAANPAPAITLVVNAEGGGATIAPNTWVTLKGAGLAPAGDSRTWQAADFVNNQLPTQLDGVSVTMNGENAYVYYISPT